MGGAKREGFNGGFRNFDMISYQCSYQFPNAVPIGKTIDMYFDMNSYQSKKYQYLS